MDAYLAFHLSEEKPGIQLGFSRCQRSNSMEGSEGTSSEAQWARAADSQAHNRRSLRVGVDGAPWRNDSTDSVWFSSLTLDDAHMRPRSSAICSPWDGEFTFSWNCSFCPHNPRTPRPAEGVPGRSKTNCFLITVTVAFSFRDNDISGHSSISESFAERVLEGIGYQAHSSGPLRRSWTLVHVQMFTVASVLSPSYFGT
jgi:hypothetical protein